MRVLILGATGRTGSLATRAALAAGHEVTALVRDPSRLDSDRRLRVLVGDATVGADIERALDGQQALISALGSKSVLRSGIAAPAAKNFVPLAEAANVRRVVVMSAFGVGETSAQAGLPVRTAFATVLRSLYNDKTSADEIVRGSSLDWTLVHPVTLTDDAATGGVTAAERLSTRGAMRISRADVADFLVSCLASSQWSRKTVVVTS